MKQTKHFRDLMIAMLICGGFLLFFGTQLLVFLTGHTWWGRIVMASEAIVPAIVLITMGVKNYLEERNL